MIKISEKLQKKYPDIIKGIMESKILWSCWSSKQSRISLLEIMTDDQRKKMKDILKKEKVIQKSADFVDRIKSDLST